jgi:hypothetical protein
MVAYGSVRSIQGLVETSFSSKTLGSMVVKGKPVVAYRQLQSNLPCGG